MTISNVTEKTQYTSTGQTTFAYTFKILADADILVVTTNLTTGVDTTHNLTTDYTVTGAGNDSGGNVVFNSATTSGHRVTLTRNMALTQTTDLVTQGGFSADVLETSLDRLTMFAQQLTYSIKKGLETPTSDTSTISDLPTQTDRASKFLAFDSSGNPIAAETVTGSAASTWGEAWIQKTTGQAAADVLTNTDGFSFKFGADLDTTLTHTDGTGLTLNSTNKLTFGDAASFVQQSGDGVLRIDGEATIDLNASTAVTVSNDLKLDSDSAVLGFGADNDVTLTHVADTGVTLSAGDNDTVLQINSNNADAGIAPIVILNRTSDSPADNDYGGEVRYNMENDNNQQFTAGAVTARATDVSDGTEDAKIILQSMVAGTLTTGLEIVGGRIGSSAYSPAGSIVQVVQNTSVGSSTTSSTTAVDVTNYTVDITPSSASNRVIVMFSASHQYSLVTGVNVSYWHKLVGGNLAVSGKLIPAQPWAGITAADASGGIQATGAYTWVGMDNPESTSAVTYKVQHYVTNASSTGYCYYGQIVAMEVQV